MKKYISFITLISALASALVLTACGSGAPSADEIAAVIKDDFGSRVVKNPECRSFKPGAWHCRFDLEASSTDAAKLVGANFERGSFGRLHKF